MMVGAAIGVGYKLEALLPVEGILHVKTDQCPLGNAFTVDNGAGVFVQVPIIPGMDMHKDGVSALPIVNENDSLSDIYSRSDITALAKDRAYSHIRLEEMSIHQALQLGQDASSPFGFFNGQRCQMCLRSDPLLKVMERLSIPGVRRVVVVEAGSKRVEGIISLSDVFKFLLG